MSYELKHKVRLKRLPESEAKVTLPDFMSDVNGKLIVIFNNNNLCKCRSIAILSVLFLSHLSSYANITDRSRWVPCV